MTRGGSSEAAPIPAAWLRTQKTRSGRWLSLAVGVGVLSGFLLILQAWLLARVIDGVIVSGAGLAEVQAWLWPMLGLFALRAALAWASEQAAFQGAVRVKLELRDALYAKIRALGPVRLGTERSGDLATSLVDGIEALEAYYARFLPAISLMALIPLSILAVVFPADWPSALIMLGTAPLIPLFMVLIGSGAERLNQRQWRKLARLSAHFLDVIQGLTTLKLFNASRRESAMVAEISDAYRRGTMEVLRVAFLSSLTLEFFATLSIAVVAVAIGFRLLFGEMGFLHGFFVLLLAPEFYLPLRNLGTHYHARLEAIGAAERMVEILSTPLPAAPAPYLQAPDLTTATIRFVDVSFDYPGQRRALRGLSLEIHPGERVALVGPSGSGKSTLINLLLGFIGSDRGRILIGDAPLGSVDPSAWRRQIAWVPQSPRLFHGTLLDNIRLGLPDASLAQVRESARLARADGFIDQLPQGFATMVGEGGQGLSGGEIRRIALARALLRDAPLVILDEPTASLDPASEAQVAAGLEALARGRTLLVVAHRLNTLRAANRILVLHEGSIEAEGDHASLVRTHRLYRRMVAAGGRAP